MKALLDGTCEINDMHTAAITLVIENIAMIDFSGFIYLCDFRKSQ